eukprot:scaffold11891_cov213-Skeletonema_menzelii.AAC.1
MEEFHIPRKKNITASSANDTSSSSNKGDDGAAGDIAATPSKPQRSEPMSSPDKSPGGRQILRRGDLVRLSNEQRSGRIQGGLARIARIRYAEEASADQSTSEPIYDIEYILGGKVSNVDRNDLEYTTATAEGLIDTDDGTRGLRRKRTKRGEENVTTKQKEKASKKQNEKISKKQNQNVATTNETPIKRKRGRPPKNPKKASTETAEPPESTTKRPRNANSDFERPPTSRQLANMEKEGEWMAESPKPKKKKKSDVAMFDRIPTSRQLANMEQHADEPVEYSQSTKKSGKANTNAAKSAGKRKNTKASKDASQKMVRRSNSRITETSESGADTTSDDPNESRRLNLEPPF